MVLSESGFPMKRSEPLSRKINAAKFAEENAIEPEIRTMRDAIHQPVPDLNLFMFATDTAIIELPHCYENEHAYQRNLYYLMRDSARYTHEWNT